MNPGVSITPVAASNEKPPSYAVVWGLLATSRLVVGQVWWIKISRTKNRVKFSNLWPDFELIWVTFAAFKLAKDR